MEAFTESPICIKCKSGSIGFQYRPVGRGSFIQCKCMRCGHAWNMAPADLPTTREENP